MQRVNDFLERQFNLTRVKSQAQNPRPDGSTGRDTVFCLRFNWFLITFSGIHVQTRNRFLRRSGLKFRKSSVYVLCFLWLTTLWGCGKTGDGASHRTPRDIQWVTKSIEYAALCTQVYRMAWPVVKEAAGKEKSNWVVVFDVDETVLDNSRYAVERAAVDSGFTRQSWTAWVRRAEAPPVPGAKALIDSIRTLGPRAHVAFITDRLVQNEQPTVENLKKVGLFRDGDIILTKTGSDDQKEDRRRCLQSGTGRCAGAGPLVILALFGDNVRDFIPMQGLENATRYRKQELPQDERWGKRFFVLPNPTYGSWMSDYR
ncbi:MAG: hypothetical protein D6743_16100 [Calditrichaeota bacterium]|nr:MAG: hypothetical protein D6743_16100 [Calditrichota bacterium]